MQKFLKKLNILLALSLLVTNLFVVGAYVGTPDGEGEPAPCGITDDCEIN